MSCEVTSTRIEVVQGDTSILRFTITEGDCTTPQDLTLFTILRFTIKRSNQDPDSAAIFSGTLADGDIALVGSPTLGVIDVTVPPSASILLRMGRPYYWDVQIEADADTVYTPRYGTLFAVAQSSRTS